jgi:YHS domain-containing protein
MLSSAVSPGILPGSIRSGTAPAAREAPMAIEIDPVCGMEVDTTTSQLSYEHEGTTYWFCGKGCLLEFKDDPERFLDPDYVPSM